MSFSILDTFILLITIIPNAPMMAPSYALLEKVQSPL